MERTDLTALNRTRDFEVQLLLDALRYRCGFDFSNYVQVSLRRRLMQALSSSDIQYVSEAIPRVLYDQPFFHKLFYALSVTVTEFFRDPSFYRILREQIVPILKTYPFINIWHAGCATGEEIYSLAILLQEEGLYDKTRIYATDINNRSLAMAKEGVYPLETMREQATNYQKAGGKGALANYYLAKYDLALMDPELQKNVVFSTFNLVTDNVFAEIHLVFCRNVLIYFDQTLQNRVLRLLHDSLVHGGILCLGSRESVKFSDVADCLLPVSEKWRIFQKQVTVQNRLGPLQQDG